MSDVSLFEQFVAFGRSAKEALEAFEQTKVRIAFTGMSGAGKSTLINGLVGRKAAETKSVESTRVGTEYECNGLFLVDLPGCDTKNWPRETYVERLRLHVDYDAIVIVTATRFYEADSFLFQQLHVRYGRPVFMVRTKFDDALRSDVFDENLGEEALLVKLGADLIAELVPRPSRIYIVSGREPARWDLPTLQADLVSALAGLKRDRLRASLHAWTDEALRQKRLLAMDLAGKYAACAALNGLNPIPGLDIAVDLGILSRMTAAIVKVYGVEEANVEWISRLTGRRVAIPAIARLGSWLTREGIVLALRRWAPRLVAREWSKWIPFVGQIISAAIGFKLTLALAEEFVDACDQAARDLLRELSHASA